MTAFEPFKLRASPTEAVSSDLTGASGGDMAEGAHHSVFDVSGMARLTDRFAWRFGALMALTDLIAITLAFGCAILFADAVRYLLGMPAQPELEFIARRGQAMVLLALLAILVFAFGGLYRRSAWELSEIKRIFGGIGLVALFDATLQYVVRDHDSRLWFVAAYPMAAAFVVSLRMMIRSHPRLKKAMTSHVVLIGDAITPDLLVNELRENRSGPVRLLRRVGAAVLADSRPEEIAAALDAMAAEEGLPARKILTVLAPTPAEIPATQKLLAALNAARRPYSIVLPFQGLARHGLRLQEVIGADMILAEMTPVGERRGMRIFKRLFDVLVGSLALLIFSPIMILAALALMLEGGPVFFTQMRVGKGGARFRCIKFRSMRPDAEQRLTTLLESDAEARREWAAHQKLACDPRITRLGDFLRRTSIDELPQIFNVLRGEMSLVGPRPIIAPEVEGYPSDKAYFESPEFTYYARSIPGITGLWQVSGRADTTHEERVRLDRWYYRNWSIWLDLVVIFKTIGAVLGGHGSR